MNTEPLTKAALHSAIKDAVGPIDAALAPLMKSIEDLNRRIERLQQVDELAKAQLGSGRLQ